MNEPTPPDLDDCDACIVKWFWEEALDFCGCGIQGPTLGIFRDVMQTMANAVDCKAIKTRKERVKSWEDALEERDRIFGGNTAWEYLVYYTLHARGLTEHGGAVPGWLTDKGEMVLAALSGKTDNDLGDMLDHEHDET